MSSGPFVRTRYQLDNASNAAIRVQPETLALTIDGVANAAPGGTVTVPGSASVSRGARANGINARTVTFVFNVAPAGYKQDSPIRLPWLASLSFTNILAGQTGSYLGSPITVIGKSPEKIR